MPAQLSSRRQICITNIIAIEIACDINIDIDEQKQFINSLNILAARGKEH